jgi:hypothetical protein
LMTPASSMGVQKFRSAGPFHIPCYTVIYSVDTSIWFWYHTILGYTSYVEVYHYTEKVQVHCDVAVIWLYDLIGTCTISGILCYGTPRYIVLIQVVGFLRGIFIYYMIPRYTRKWMYIHWYTRLSSVWEKSLRKPTTWINMPIPRCTIA